MINLFGSTIRKFIPFSVSCLFKPIRYQPNHILLRFERRENGQEKRLYQLSPIEKEIVLGNSTLVRKLIGFRPEAKIVTTYPNPFSLIMRRVKDMYLTLSGLVSPDSDVKLRNMGGPVGIVNHLSIFAKIGFKKLLWFVVFYQCKFSHSKPTSNTRSGWWSHDVRDHRKSTRKAPCL